MELRIDEACNSRAGQWQWPPSDAVSGVDRDSQMPYFPVPSAWWAPEAIGTLRAQLRSLMLPDFPTLVYPPTVAGKEPVILIHAAGNPGPCMVSF